MTLIIYKRRLGKRYLYKLRDLEHEPSRLEGFILNPISVAEAKALQRGLYRVNLDILNYKNFVGHVDPGETVMKTALRETQEESGLVQDDLNIFENSKTTSSYNVDGVPKIVYYWVAELVNSNAVVKLSDEHQDYKWLNIEEACKYAQFKEMQKVLLDCDKYIRNELACCTQVNNFQRILI